VPREFRFSVKIPRTITHDAELKCGPEELTAFLKQVSFLRQKLGPLLVQLPPSGVFNQAVAKRFFVLLRNLHDGDVVLEGRHRTWFSAGADDLLKQFRIAGVAADPACVPPAGGPTGHAHVFYFRLHGSPRLLRRWRAAWQIQPEEHGCGASSTIQLQDSRRLTLSS
jgi:uncharacterized protein YecE (DUF72 family)